MDIGGRTCWVENVDEAEWKCDLGQIDQWRVCVRGRVCAVPLLILKSQETARQSESKTEAIIQCRGSIISRFPASRFPPRYPPGKYTDKEKRDVWCLPWESPSQTATMGRIRNVFNQRMTISAAAGGDTTWASVRSQAHGSQLCGEIRALRWLFCFRQHRIKKTSPQCTSCVSNNGIKQGRRKQ